MQTDQTDLRQRFSAQVERIKRKNVGSQWESIKKLSDSYTDLGEAALPARTIAEVLIEHDLKIMAIKWYRLHKNVGLVEAKRWVDEVDQARHFTQSLALAVQVGQRLDLSQYGPLTVQAGSSPTKVLVSVTLAKELPADQAEKLLRELQAVLQANGI